MKRICISLLLVLNVLVSYAVLPDVVLQDMNGKDVQVADLATSGKPIIISFFATWCKPCMRELDAIHDLYPDWQDKYGANMYIVSIDHGQDAQMVKPLVNGNGWEYEVLLDSNEALKRAMNVQNIPHLFVVNSKGDIVYQHVGYNAGDEAEIHTYLR